jgi:beta-aspartyl-peptidase (threonine type)
LQEAADFVIHNELEKLKGDGGLIAVDNKGNIAFSFNTEGMFRGYLKSDGKKEILFYK